MSCFHGTLVILGAFCDVVNSRASVLDAPALWTNRRFASIYVCMYMYVWPSLKNIESSYTLVTMAVS